MQDLLIKNGYIIDGSGSAPYSGDIAVQNGRITRIDRRLNETAEKVIDARGAYVTPGFIDVSNHSDTHLTLFTQPELTSLIRQGITTIIGGNCGTSLAPLISGKAIESVRRWVPMNRINVNWLTVKEYYQELARRRVRVNYGTLIGYLTVRRGLLHDEFRPVTDEELDALLKIVEDGFKEGALGVSFGLAYSHLYMADHSELRAIAQLTANYNRVLTVHMRDEGTGVVDSVKEVIQLARETGVRAEISHLKILGEKNWNMFEQVLDLISDAREEGLLLEVDIFPYRANNGVLYLQLPYWVTKGGKERMLKRLQNSDTKNNVIAEMKRNSEDYSRMVISSAPENERLVGKTVTEVARNQRVGIEEAILNLIIATNSQITTLNYAIKPGHVYTLAEQEYTTIGSDGVGYSDDVFQQYISVHPRSFGALPKFWNLSQINLSPEERIFRMTGKPAAHYRLTQRGQLKKGYRADILVFNPETFNSPATLKDPLAYGEGIRHVFVNGKRVIHNDEETEVYPGELM